MNSSLTANLLAQVEEAARYVRKGRRAEGLAIYEEVAQRAESDAAVHVQLGHFCSEFHALDEAIEHYAFAVEQEPDNAYYLGFLGVAYQQRGDREEALNAFERAMEINAEIPAVLNGLGVIHLARDDYEQARNHLERAVRLKPGDATIRTNYATSLMQLDEHDQALKHVQRALKQDPLNPHSHYIVGTILTESGRTDEAVRHFERTIRAHRTFGPAYNLLAHVRKFTADDRAFIEKTERILKESMAPDQRYSVHYALGKMYDDCREWDKAFEHFRQANLLKRKPIDIDEERKVFRKVRKAFDGATLERYRAFGHPSKQPVFIVGMPRSGTTLMEQMIASHPQAAGGNELQEIPRIAERVSPRDDLHRFVSATHANLTPESIQTYAQEYLGVLRQGREAADRIVDKLPGNYFYLGFISILFPNATIIHAMRHPLDVCLSCYFQNFTQLGWANDFKAIAAMYRSYREAIAYWKRVLPEGKILDVQYERLIEDQPNEGRRMIEHCGLEWDSSMLQFHRQERVVKTASFWQVRQPIYRSSKMRWKNYAPHLAELAVDLAEYLQDDREDLKAHGIELPAGSGAGWLKRLIG
jgi:tetratricopeptide (TPR) repeat protein